MFGPLKCLLGPFVKFLGVEFDCPNPRYQIMSENLLEYSRLDLSHRSIM